MKEEIYELINTKEYYSIQEIMEGLKIPKEKIPEVKRILEDGVDLKEIERALKYKKPWYRRKPVE